MSGAENVYWVFSAAAQTVAAFVAFLLAGYALVHSMMDAAAQVDDTLVEIHDLLKAQYHQQLSLIAVATAASIVLCLLVVFLNAYSFDWFAVLLAIAAMVTAGSLLGAVAFVIRIVDPKKYRKAAKQLVREAESVTPTQRGAPSTEFFSRFVAVEQVMRALFQRRAVRDRLGSRQGPPSFREMLDALFFAEAVPKDLYERLKQINRYRNLVFHGHVTDVEPAALTDLDQVLKDLMRLSGAV